MKQYTYDGAFYMHKSSSMCTYLPRVKIQGMVQNFKWQYSNSIAGYNMEEEIS